MNAIPKEATVRRETSTVERIPYVAHVSPHIVKTVSGDYVQVIRLGGASFECADDETLNNWHERLNVTWRNIASPNVALWAHLIRRRDVPQVPQARTRSTRSPGPASGSGRDSSRISPGACSRAVFILPFSVCLLLDGRTEHR